MYFHDVAFLPGLAILQEVVVVFVDRFSIALFSALEQTHCALAACDSE